MMRDKPLAFYIKRTWDTVSKYMYAKYPICQVCSRAETGGIHHICHKSTAKALMFDMVNIIAVCGSCHHKLHPTTPKRHTYDFIEEVEIFERIIGRDGIEYLQQHRHDIANWTRDELEDIRQEYKNKLKEL